MASSITLTMAAVVQLSLLAMSKNNAIEVEDDEESIDEEQLEEFKEMVEQLGSFADKVTISSLSMIADDHKESKASANAIYNVIRKRLFNTSRDNMLPLVYVLDSIVKNAKGYYIDIMEADAAKWIPRVNEKLQDTQRVKLQKVWRTWNEFKIFSEENWKAMGRCFDDRANGKAVGSTVSEVAGISRTKDGSLILTAGLRIEMQHILDDIQSDVTNELEKVSLERLADINPDLLANIKKTAEDSMRSGTATSSATSPLNSSNKHHQDSSPQSLPAFFIETRSEETLARSKAWQDLRWDQLKETHDVITKLQHRVRDDVSSEKSSMKRYCQEEAMHMTHYFATALTTASLLTSTLERIKSQQDAKSAKTSPFDSGGAVSGMGFAVDKREFTNEGIKKKNETAVGMLYQMGLPFVSSADGRRFATQIELSNHLDALFRRNQLEKSMARTEERGWYVADLVWMGEAKPDELELQQTSALTATPMEEENDPERSTVPADENRDRCVICGINFKMFFDNEDGIYKYNNCREMEVLNDDAAERESEQELVHVTCWTALGSPEVLTIDQTLQL